MQIANGNLNYILGMNIGLRARQVLQAPGADPVDLNYVGASLINGVGTRWGAQTVNLTEYEVWSQLTTMTGPGGDSDTVTGTVGNWNVSPFDYSRGLSGHGAETFIKTDANVIMLVDALDRAMHPKLVVEAESGSSSPPVMMSSNNVPPGLLNGGLSAINITSGYSLTYSSLVPPEPDIYPWHNFRYRVRLRASNTGSSPCTVTVLVTQGAYQWTDSIIVPVTNAVHNYVVVDNNNGFYQSSPLTLATGLPFSVVLSIGGTGAGPCAFDNFVIESEGIPR